MTALPIVRPGRLSPARAEALLARARSADPTYAPVGSTLDPAFVAGPGDLRLDRPVGSGPEAFGRAVACFRALDPQRAVATVWPVDATAEVGTEVLVALPFGPVTVVAVNRIVALVDEPRRWGFAYGTLPGHSEVGEEAFLVEHRADDTVVASIVARAHVALPGGVALQRVLLPLQRRFASRYLDAVDRAVRA